MNCCHFQDLIFEYVEGSLPPADHAAVQEHVASCATCRNVFVEQQQIAQSFCERFRRETEALVLHPRVQREVMTSLRVESAEEAHPPSLLWWRRLAWPAGIAAAITVAAVIMTGFPAKKRPPMVHVSEAPGQTAAPVFVRLSDCTPTYRFNRQDDMVVDSLTCDPRLVEQTLWLSESRTGPKPAPKLPL